MSNRSPLSADSTRTRGIVMLLAAVLWSLLPYLAGAAPVSRADVVVPYCSAQLAQDGTAKAPAPAAHAGHSRSVVLHFQALSTPLGGDHHASWNSPGSSVGGVDRGAGVLLQDPQAWAAHAADLRLPQGRAPPSQGRLQI